MFETLNISAFLEEYQKYPCLWLKFCPDFKNRLKRDAAEAALLEFSRLPSIKLLRRKIRSIRGTYNNQRAKVRKSMLPGNSQHDVYKPKLVWYDLADSFLWQNEAANDYQSIMESEEDQSDENQFSPYSQDAAESSAKLHLNVAKKSHPGEECPSRTPARKKKIIDLGSPKQNLGESLASAVQVLKQVADSSNTNEFTHFGMHVASQLSALPLKAAIELQSEIQTLITSVRLKHLSNEHQCTPCV